MAQVTVYGLQSSIEQHRASLSSAIHAAIVGTLDYPPEKKFQRFILLTDDNFIYPVDRGEEYTIIEISMFEGRTEHAKRSLIAELFARIEAEAGIDPHSLEITILDSPRVNWGIRGVNAADLPLNYHVNI